jgi:hypothetical protein
MNRSLLLAFSGFVALLWLLFEWPYSFWLSILVTAPLWWLRDREALRQALKWNPQVQTS